MLRRAILPTVFALAACSGGKDTTAPAPVASVTVTAASASISIGDTTRLTARTLDASGAVLTGRTVTFSTGAAGVASVTSGGVVTGVAAGAAVITATSEGKTGSVVITVAASLASCVGVTPVSMSVGEVQLLSGTNRTTLCAAGGSSGAEYALIPVNTSSSRLSETVQLAAANTSIATGPPAATQANVSAAQITDMASSNLIASLQQVEGAMPRNYAFERALRERTREMRSAAAAMARAGSSVRPPFANITNLDTMPPIGTLVSLNASGTSSCTTPITRTGRVMVVSSTAIVIEDTLRPAGGLTTAQYSDIAATFDTLVFPLDTTSFGAPFDMDHNHRIVMFFTTAVNQLTAKGATSVIDGFFFERDLFPRVATTQVPVSCATSNEGEMFYLPVVDAASQFNGFFTSAGTLKNNVIATTIHEFQHLINASRRIYVTPQIVQDEEPWLNEAMSHLAQEILYLHVAGLTPKADVTFATSTQTATRLTAMQSYESDNLFNYSNYLRAIETSSPFAANDDLTTRGAACALLRYALDQSPNPPEFYLRALVDAPTQGIPNFNLNFGQLGGLAGAVRAAAVANFTDDTAVPVGATYTYPTWNYRDWLPHFTSNASTFPLSTRSLPGGANVTITLAGGGSSLIRFHVAGGATGAVAVTYSGAGGSDAVELMLVRTQ